MIKHQQLKFSFLCCPRAKNSSKHFPKILPPFQHVLYEKLFACLTKNLIPLLPPFHIHIKILLSRNFIPRKYLANERNIFLCFEQIKRERQDVELGMEHKSNKEPLPAIQTLPFFFRKLHNIKIEKDSPTLIVLMFSSPREISS